MSLGDCLHCWDNPCTCGEGVSKPVKKIINDLKSKLTAANQRIRELTEWRPMESAPRDGTPILVMVEDEIGIMHMTSTDDWTGWVWTDELLDNADPVPPMPIRWLPLPKGDV